MRSDAVCEQEWTVGPAAALVGTTVRTLHHYDSIGLVVASGRTFAGYRTYLAADLDRLRHVLVYRELGFSLDRIRDLLAGDAGARAQHLRVQHDVVGQRIDRLQQVRAALEQEIEAEMTGSRLTQQDKRELFGDDWLGEDYAAEAEQRWGDTESWTQSQQRTAAYSKEQWQELRAETVAVEEALVECLSTGVPADSDTAMDLAEQLRLQIHRWFYDCPPQLHAGLGRLYVEDERFTGYYERQAPGLAQFVSTAIVANSLRQSPG